MYPMAACSRAHSSPGPSGGTIAAMAQIEIADIPATGVAAIGSITADVNPDAGDTITVGSKTYTYVIGAPGANQIQQGADADATATNTALRINTDTVQTQCTAENIGLGFSFAVRCTANEAGVAGNSIPLSATAIGLSGIVAGPFDGGVDQDTITIGTKTYGFVEDHPGPDEIEVAGGSSSVASLLADKINADTVNTQCTGVWDTSTLVNLTANVLGVAGNSIPLSSTSAGINLTPFSGGS